MQIITQRDTDKWQKKSSINWFTDIRGKTKQNKENFDQSIYSIHDRMLKKPKFELGKLHRIGRISGKATGDETDANVDRVDAPVQESV